MKVNAWKWICFISYIKWDPSESKKALTGHPDLVVCNYSTVEHGCSARHRLPARGGWGSFWGQRVHPRLTMLGCSLSGVWLHGKFIYYWLAGRGLAELVGRLLSLSPATLPHDSNPQFPIIQPSPSHGLILAGFKPVIGAGASRFFHLQALSWRQGSFSSKTIPLYTWAPRGLCHYHNFWGTG